MISKLSQTEINITKEYLVNHQENLIHHLASFFEENDRFKLMYDTGEELIDLKEVSHNEGNAGFLNGEVLDWIDDYGIKLKE